MAPTRRRHAIVVRIVFALAFLVLLVPGRLMALAHGAVIARVAGATLSTLLVWWCLYRLCMRAKRQAWFVAASIPVLARRRHVRDRDDLVVVVAFALQLTIALALGAASVILVRHQRDATLIAMLRQNSRHTWLAALLHLCGIGTPRRRAPGALVHRSVLLSAPAFCLEGTAFYVYFHAGMNFLKAGDRVVASGVMLSPFPGRLSLLEAHYVNVVIITAVLLPILYVTTQVTLTLADRLRHAARRAAVRSADDLLNEDERPHDPVPPRLR